ncbi:Conserved_hypothetical protein [Hexamita inflata]|uniref:Uncharacterized protein n=1 Tax=Hexamita inflata TaxID=28002 RepID=A0AA86UU17_9EUKA|nr:Conserved hypothetical protein [Hexamita inflata]
MRLNQVIRSKEELLNHFNSSKKLEIRNLEQTKDLLVMNVPSEVWEDASNSNLLYFNSQFVQQTKQLKFEDKQIEYIQLVYYLTNLTELNLSENKISDISAVSQLKNLKELELRDNRIEDISALQSLPNLTHLDLYQNEFTSYTLALPNLVQLQLDSNKLIDTSGLQYSPKLESLNLSQTDITDLRSIPNQIFGVKELYLFQNGITEISYLSNFVNVQKLYLGKNQQLQNIGPLKFCTQLNQVFMKQVLLTYDLFNL